MHPPTARITRMPFEGQAKPLDIFVHGIPAHAGNARSGAHIRSAALQHPCPVIAVELVHGAVIVTSDTGPGLVCGAGKSANLTSLRALSAAFAL